MNQKSKEYCRKMTELVTAKWHEALRGETKPSEAEMFTYDLLEDIIQQLEEHLGEYKGPEQRSLRGQIVRPPHHNRWKEGKE